MTALSEIGHGAQIIMNQDKGIEEKITKVIDSWKPYELQGKIWETYKDGIVQALTKLVKGEVREFADYLIDDKDLIFASTNVEKTLKDLLKEYLSTLSPEQEGGK